MQSVFIVVFRLDCTVNGFELDLEIKIWSVRHC